MQDINLISLCLKYNVDFFLHARNMHLEDSVNAIFLHKIDEVTLKNSLGDLILGMNKDNFMQKVYHCNESDEDD